MRGEDGPTMVVGGVAMPWGEFNAMISEMEMRQKPFKAWIKNEFAPAYSNFLRENLKEKAVGRHEGIADIFFERVLHVGFLMYEDIRPEFALVEFPRWWDTHVIGMTLTASQVASSIRKLSEFVRETYNFQMNGKSQTR